MESRNGQEATTTQIMMKQKIEIDQCKIGIGTGRRCAKDGSHLPNSFVLGTTMLIGVISVTVCVA